LEAVRASAGNTAVRTSEVSTVERGSTTVLLREHAWKLSLLLLEVGVHLLELAHEASVGVDLIAAGEDVVLSLLASHGLFALGTILHQVSHDDHGGARAAHSAVD